MARLYNICLCPKYTKMPGVLIELRAAKDCSDHELKKLSEIAPKQINDRKYETELAIKGVKNVFKFGVAFCEKRVEITENKSDNDELKSQSTKKPI